MGFGCLTVVGRSAFNPDAEHHQVVKQGLVHVSYLPSGFSQKKHYCVYCYIKQTHNFGKYYWWLMS